MKAVHFGAGNIGRGFVGLLLHNAGYDLVFADVADALIEAAQGRRQLLRARSRGQPADPEVRGFSALNSATEADALTAAIASADIVTTAVGAHILKFVAPAIAAGIAARPAGAPKLAVMACENAINGTDILAGEVRKAYAGADLDDRVIFANTAVDRIVPNQDPNAGLDVTVENFFEWAIETPPFGEVHPGHPRCHLGARPRAVHRAQAVHGQHRARHQRVVRLRGGHREDLRRPRRPRRRGQGRGGAGGDQLR